MGKIDFAKYALGLLFGGGFVALLTFLLTAKYVRRKAAADVGQVEATTQGLFVDHDVKSRESKAKEAQGYSETVQGLISSLSGNMDKLGLVYGTLNDCLTAKTNVEIRLKECEAESTHKETSLKILREQNTEYEKRIIALQNPTQ